MEKEREPDYRRSGDTMPGYQNIRLSGNQDI
jgi:hypothetical protein